MPQHKSKQMAPGMPYSMVGSRLFGASSCRAAEIICPVGTGVVGWAVGWAISAFGVGVNVVGFAVGANVVGITVGTVGITVGVCVVGVVVGTDVICCNVHRGRSEGWLKPPVG